MLLSLLLAGGIIWLGYCGMKFVWTALSSVNPSLAVGIIAAGSTIFVSLASVLISKRLEQKTLIKNQQRDKKIPIYEELITFLFKIWRNAMVGTQQPTEKEMVDFMIGFTQKLLIWGSDEVVASFCKFRKAGQDSSAIMFAIEDIWLAIRRDLGHDNKGISKGMLLGLIVSDIDDFIKKT
jgi:hypothetical protein